MTTQAFTKHSSRFPMTAGEAPALPVSARLLAQLSVILLSAFLLKQHYSTASVNELRWILTPTTWLVQLATGQTFTFESNAGYMNGDHTFLIAASCAGVNFLITAFLMLSVRQVWLSRLRGMSWSVIPIVAVGAYVATLVTNAFRIILALQMRSMELGAASSVTRAELHRLEGIVVYFGFLLLLFVVSDRLSETKSSSAGLRLEMARNQSGDISESSASQKLFSQLKRVWFPLVIYYTTTLVFPIANAAYHGRGLAQDFWKHSAFVIVTPLLFLLALIAVRRVLRVRFWDLRS
jgi:exosortase K